MAEGDLLKDFIKEFKAVQGEPVVVSDPAQALEQLLKLVDEKGAKMAATAPFPLSKGMDLTAALRKRGVTVIETAPEPKVTGEAPQGPGTTESEKAASDAVYRSITLAGVGITGITWAIAETGTLVIVTDPGYERLVSLLPPVHVAVFERSRIVKSHYSIVPDLEKVLKEGRGRRANCISFITGPSRTGDVAFEITLGAHGPEEVHAIIVDR